jgi:hypothetical protein
MMRTAQSGEELRGSVAASGWFADPLGRHEKRFFNGIVRTSDVLDGTQRGADPVRAATATAQHLVQPGAAADRQLPPPQPWQSRVWAQAWRDGDELVMRLGTPLPPICVFCGAPAVVGLRNAINTRGHPFGNLQVLSTRVPVCEEDRRRHRAVMTRANVTVVVVFVMVLLTGTLPGPLGLLSNAMNPFGGRIPTAGAVALALTVAVGLRVVHRLVRSARGKPRPVMLRYDRSQGGFVWLQGADPRCLAQLPPVAQA